MPEPPADPRAQRLADRKRLSVASRITLLSVAGLVICFGLQGMLDWRPFAVSPQTLAGLPGVLTAPLLHGSPQHLIANATAILLLLTLSITVYPKATLRAMPLMWLGAGLAAWLLGDPGSRHLGASGVTHGLMFLVFTLGLLRRDRPSIAAGMIAFFFYGGMLLTVLPQEPGVSWQSHLGGALGGIVGAWLFRRADPVPPRRKYSWDLEAEQAELDEQARREQRDTWEPPPPHEVPVLWQRPQREDEERGVVLRFPPRDRPPRD